MARRLALAAVTVLVGAVAAVPASAGGAKPVKGEYDVNLPPNPLLQVTGLAGDGCDTFPVPVSTDDHPFKAPGAGTLAVVLDSPTPAGNQPAIDWDLWILDSSRQILGGSHGETAHEEVSLKLKKAADLIIQVCNLSGAPQGHVSFTFTPKK